MPDNDLGLRYWNRRRLSRRTMLAGTAAGAAGLAAIGLVGCGGDDDGGDGNGPPTSRTTTVQDGSQDGPGKPGGILRTRQATGLPSMNPFGPGIFALAQQLTLGFTVFDHPWYVPTDTGTVELFLATELEQPDALSLTFKIGDAVFQDKGPAPGRKVTAEDVAASYKRFRDEAPIGYSWLHAVMEDIVAVDERTVRITQKQPWAWIFTSSNAGSPISSSIMPVEVLGADQEEFRKGDAVGSGHWILDDHDNGINLKFRKFANFRQFQGTKDITGQPFLDGVDSIYIADANAALAAFKAGDLDVYGFASKKESDDTAAELGNKIVTSSDLSRDYVNLMLKYEDPFKDERVREAINKLIDRDEAILLLEDGNGLKAGPMPPAHKAYVLPDDDPVLVDYFKPDVDKARQLLEAAGWNFDDEIELKHSNRPVDSKLAEVLKGQLARGGFKVKLVQEDLVKWFSTTLNGHDFKMTCFQHLPYEDPDLPLRFYLSPEGDRTNFMEYKDAEVDAAILAAATELDQEARVQKVYEAQRVIMRKQAPMINILSAINYGARYAYVKGSITGRGSFGIFNRTTWLDKA